MNTWWKNIARVGIILCILGLIGSFIPWRDLYIFSGPAHQRLAAIGAIAGGILVCLTTAAGWIGISSSS